MAEPLDAFRYISYFRSRWRWIAASAAAALLLAVTVSLLMTREYTATARIVIEPPAGADLRAAMAVSPVYLEALKTYEEFATSDKMFETAVEQFRLRTLLESRSIEALKRRVLKVGVIRNTRILEISATLPDPRTAYELAKSLAESTVDLNRSVVSEGGQELVRTIEEQERDMQSRLQAADRQWAQLASKAPVDDLQSAIEGASETRSALEQQVSSTELELADNENRLQQVSAAEAVEIRKEQSNAKARLAELGKQLASLERRTAASERLLATRMAERDRAESERKSAQSALQAVEGRLREARGESGYRGERLRIIDPGVVPERPSSPNLPLNAAAALLLGLLLPSVYLLLSVTYQDQRASERRGAYRAVKARDV
jgi:uncharacterized protein involved in exopolysaccharide biosynthesis